MRRSLFPLAFALAIALGGVSSASALDTLSVPEFVARQEKWADDERAETSFVIEGRVSSLTTTALKFRNCELLFVLDEDVKLPMLDLETDTLEVAGRIGRREGKMVFLVTRASRRPSDLERFRARQEVIPEGDATAWRQLGAAAKARGEFYGDALLKTIATDAYQRALLAERKTLDEGDANGLLRLAAEAAQLELPETFRHELAHEAFHIQHDAVNPKDPQALAELAVQISERLPGCEIPLSEDSAELGQQYEKKPLETYARAEADERRKMHRMLYSEVVLQQIKAHAAAVGQNGFETAKAIVRDVPEYSSVAAEYKDRELADRVKNAANLTRSEAVEVADEYRKRNDDATAERALRDWLAAKTERLRTEGSSGLLQASDEYRALLEDNDTAAKLLQEAHKLDPTSKEVARRLTSLGYELVGSDWYPKREAPPKQRDPQEMQISGGRIAAGMTAEQIRKTLGVPESVGRIVTSKGINEIWSYNRRDGARISVHFTRSRITEPLQARATAVFQSQR